MRAPPLYKSARPLQPDSQREYHLHMAVSLSPNSVHSTATGASALARRVRYVRDLLLVLVSRDIKLRYKRSFLGLAWSLLNPLAQFVILNFVFSTVLPLGVSNYTSFLFTGVLAWNWSFWVRPAPTPIPAPL